MVSLTEIRRAVSEIKYMDGKTWPPS